MAEVDLNVICKHCGSEVSPYITECPYCGQRLRKRAPKLTPPTAKAPSRKPRRRLRLRPRRKQERALTWLSADRPVATIALVLGAAALYLVQQATTLSLVDVGAIFGPLDGDWWRLLAAQFVYENVGYLLAVAIATAIFGTSLERRYGAAVPLAVFLASGVAGFALVTLVDDFPLALGGNGSALGLLAAWIVRDVRDRRAEESESDLLGVAAIAAVLAFMPLLETTADAWVGLGGAAAGAVLGLALPSRR